MVPLFVSIHCCIILCCSAILAFIVHFLKKKNLHQENITTVIQTDLAILTGLFVNTFSVNVIVRELHGPFQLSTIQFTQFGLSTLFSADLYAFLSLQLVQVIFLFKPTTLSEVDFSRLVHIYRIFVFICAVSNGYFISHQKKSECHLTPICLYLHGTQPVKEATKSTSVLYIVIFVVIGLISCLQVTV